jgi:uncharacterized protein YdaU (DUF1376 family)
MDPDFIKMTAAERGVYCTLIFYLYCNNGRCAFDMPTLARLSNCRNFASLWENIKHKFQVLHRTPCGGAGTLRHKRVSEELKKAKEKMQIRSKAGVVGATKRWQTHNKANGNAVANEKRNVNEKDKVNNSISNSRLQSELSSISARLESGSGARASDLRFHEALIRLIRPRNQSDRTCFRNITNWLIAGRDAGKFNDDIFERVLDYAREATLGRKPAAVFMSLLKKELGYKPNQIGTAVTEYKNATQS